MILTKIKGKNIKKEGPMANYEKAIVSKKTGDISLWSHINHDNKKKKHCNMGHMKHHKYI